MFDRATLLRATAANHRAWFRRQAAEAGGRIERCDGVDVVVTGDSGTIPFPRLRGRGRLRESLDAAVRLELRAMSCWSLEEDRTLGTLLLARGFEWGWQPHWMALDLARLAEDGATGWKVEPAAGDLPREVPYAESDPVPRAARHLVVRVDGRAAGHVVVNPWRGVAGIYDMGVEPSRQRRGIGRALTLGAGRLGRELGCTHAVLNATGEGELLYRSVGFESLGWGRTWWMHPGPRPTARQAQLVEAIGFGELGQLEALRPTAAELAEPIPGGGPPLAVAVVTAQPEMADWILERRPELASMPLEPRGGTLLHVAVEWDDEAMVRLALGHGADLAVRDGTYGGTPLGWAEHLGRPRLAALLRDAWR